MSGSDQQLTCLLAFFINRVNKELPFLLEPANHIVDLHHSQHPGYASSTEILNQLERFVGEQHWSRVYNDFLQIWARLEERRLTNSSFTNASEVIDLTESTTSEDSKQTAVTSEAAAEDPASHVTPPRDDDEKTAIKDDAVRLLSQVAAMQPEQPVARAASGASLRRNKLPLHPKTPKPPVLSLQDSNPFGPLSTPRESLAEFQFGYKPPRPATIVRKHHFALLSQMQRQVKDEASRAVMFIHSLMAKLERESPTNLFVKATNIIEDCLLRNRQQEIGYEMITGHLVDRLKALLVVARTPALAGVAASPLTVGHKSADAADASAT
ncbi:MAG: hypothetical protein SGILL_006397, partial [Bacillariaceae sp.]